MSNQACNASQSAVISQHPLLLTSRSSLSRLRELSPRIPHQSSQQSPGPVHISVSSVGTVKVSSEQREASSSPSLVARQHVLGKGQLARNGHSYVLWSFLYPPIPLKWHNGMLCSLLRTSLFKNKQAMISLICPPFSGGRRQPPELGGLGKEAGR